MAWIRKKSETCQGQVQSQGQGHTFYGNDHLGSFPGVLLGVRSLRLKLFENSQYSNSDIFNVR